MTRTHRAAVIGLVVIAAAGCGGRSARVASDSNGESIATSSTTVAPKSLCEQARTKPGTGTVGDWEGLFDGVPAPGGGINDRSQTNAAVIGTIAEVSQPQWNSINGGPWRSPHAEVARRVTLNVERVLWTDAAVGAETHKPTVLYFPGDGSDCGMRMQGRLSPRYNAAAGPINVGDRRLLLLSQSDTIVEGGNRPTTWNRNYVNNWKLRDDGIAENMDPAGSVPTDKLIDRLQKEHAKGRIKDNAAANRDNETTDQNPLATEFTP